MKNGVPPAPRLRAPVATAIALLLSLAARAQADAPSPALRAIVAELADEALALARADEVPQGKPDYAGRCSHQIAPEEISAALLGRTHREPFVDAYVRWQLTSFEPPLPEMDASAFVEFADDAPKLIENPRADAAVLELFQRANDRGKLPPRDLERVRVAFDELETRAKKAELMNRPALEFREFIADKLGDTGVLPRIWLLEELNSTVEAGWSMRSVKTRISKSFLAASREAEFPREHLAGLTALMKRFEDKSRRFVNEITILADGSVTVSFSTAGVTAGDIDKWTNRLAGVP